MSERLLVMCGTVEREVAAMGLSVPAALSAVLRGFMRCSVPQLEGVMSRLC